MNPHIALDSMMQARSSQPEQGSTPPQCRYSVILPTYNERTNLPLIIWLLVQTFTQHSIDFEVLVVEDNSPDGTLAVAQQLQVSTRITCFSRSPC